MMVFLVFITALILCSTSFATEHTSNKTSNSLNTQTSAYAAAGSPEGAESSVSFTSEQINSAATTVKSYVEENNKLPNYVDIDNQQINMPDFLYLMTQNLININNGTPTSITLTTVQLPYTQIENIETGSITKSEYITMADDINTYINTYNKAPSTMDSTLGKIRLENIIYTYSNILNFQITNDRLPNYVMITPWTGSTITKSIPVYLTSKQINTAATKVKNFVDKYKRLPSYVYVGNYQVSMPQFLKLMTFNLVYTYNGKPKSILLPTVNDQTNLDETVKKSGNISRSEYMTIAKRINTYIKSYGKAPGRTYSSLGLIRFQNMVYTYSKVLNFYAQKGRLPSSVWVKPWVYRPVYIISDIINNVTYDNQRIDYIVSALKKLGANAYNKGAGTDNIGIFQDLPSTALLVQICGGVCAGTIYENGTNYYKNLVGSREVFFVWTDTATYRITGLDWLPRAHDDNFSPPEFTGLAHPDEYLLSHGYHYYEGYNNNQVDELARILFNAARN